ncbi:MAG TPA: metallophosphoesterase family protein [Nitrospirota bacterium]|nr:metallophosphoesterase family protein [Nitrospirota bacterium]
MKIAVFGDIHGNIDALKAAYDAAMTLKPDKIYHLGDLGGYAPFVNEVVDFLVGHGIDGVQGNYDETVANDREHCGCKAEDPVQEEMANLSFAWTKKHTTLKSKNYMKSLPMAITLGAEGRSVWLFHATPHKNNLYWYEDRPERFFLEMAGKGDADIMIYGHTHKPYRKEINGKVFISAGSVGKPKDGDPRACVAVVDITPKSVNSEFIRVAYDVETVAAAIIDRGLPAYFADKLRQGA